MGFGNFKGVGNPRVGNPMEYVTFLFQLTGFELILIYKVFREYPKQIINIL